MTKTRAVHPREYNDRSKHHADGNGCYIKRHPRFESFVGIVCEESPGHGVKFIGSNKYHPAERVFWIIVFCTCLGFSLFLVARVFLKFDENPVIISFQSQETFVAQIPFPAITVCNVNLLKASALRHQAAKFVRLAQKNRYNASKVKMTPELWDSLSHLDHLGQSCLAAPSFRRLLNQTILDAMGQPDYIQKLSDDIKKKLSDKHIETMHTLENNPEEAVFRQTLISCEDMLIKCMWSGSLIECKDIFFHIETHSGHCCVFNMMPKFILQNIPLDDYRAKLEMKNIPNDTIGNWTEFAREDMIIRNPSKLDEVVYPKHQRAGGKPYGLKVLANPALKEYSTCTTNDGSGFKIVAHSPLSSPNLELSAAVPVKSEVFVDIEPIVSVVADKDRSKLKAVPIRKRGCYMPSDTESKLKHYNFYSDESCFNECWAKHTYKNCSCVRVYMPRDDRQRVCGAKDRDCADQVNENLTASLGGKGPCAHCIAPCTEIRYRLHMSHFDIRADDESAFHTFDHSDGRRENATNYSILHIYFGTDSFYATERKMLYDWIDLLANAGGLLGLTLGVSLISLIQLCYFFTLRAWMHFRSAPNTGRNVDNVASDTFGSLSTTRMDAGKRQSSKRTSGYMYSRDARNRFYSAAMRGGSLAISKHNDVTRY